MRLVFYGGGDDKDNRRLDTALFDLVGKKSPHLTFIPAQSYESEVDFALYIKQYKRFGVKNFLHFPVDIHFDTVLLGEALKSDIIHLGGGNTFYFLKHLRKSGMLPLLQKYVKDGGILTGLSAGAIMMTPTITTASFPPFDRDDNDEKIKDYQSLGLVNFEFFPHYLNSMRYREAMIKRSRKSKIPLYACPNGNGLIIKNNELQIVGHSYLFRSGKMERYCF